MRTRSSAGGLTLILPSRWGIGKLRERKLWRDQINPTARLEPEARSGMKLITQLAWKIRPAAFVFLRKRPESDQKTEKSPYRRRKDRNQDLMLLQTQIRSGAGWL